ncbi:MAG: hypothetical protein K5679_03010 [Lachnospiraceae bacterium]|nr:hypothetical protein [Lachnospiraceae bacterium]
MRNKGTKKIDCIAVDEAFYDKNLKAENISRDIIGRTIACWWVRSNSDGWKTADRSWVVGGFALTIIPLSGRRIGL